MQQPAVLRWRQGCIRASSRKEYPISCRPCTLRFYHPDSRPTPLRLPCGHNSLLPLVLSSSNLRLSPLSHNQTIRYRVSTRNESNILLNAEPVVPFYVSIPVSPECRPIGWLKPQVVQALEEDHQTELRRDQRSPWQFHHSVPDGLPGAVAFASWINAGGQQQRTLCMERLVMQWRQDQLFADILKGWSDEAYPVYHHATGSADSTVAFSIERASLPLFGFANFGCLLTSYFHAPDSGKTMVWVPRRSRTKRTWPGRLDVTVGGGISLGDTAMETIVRECAEEASLDSNYVTNNIRPVGVLPFPNRSPAGWILPGLYYLYDLPLPSDGSIRPWVNIGDGEVESFELMDVDTVLRNLVDGMFKPSSALALVDFLIRHGHITEDSDPRFADVCVALKPEMTWPLPWSK